MAEMLSMSGCEDTQCPTIYEGDQTLLSILSGQIDEYLLPKFDDSALQPNLNGIEIPTTTKVMSCEEIVKLAASRYVQSYSNGGVDYSFVSPALANHEDQRGLELVNLLFTSAECISCKQYDRAARLLTHSRKLSSQWGNPIQRLSFYFSAALQERIQRQAFPELRNSLKPPVNFANNFNSGYNKDEFNHMLAYYNRALPYVKIAHLTSVQAILDSLVKSSRIHVIDLEIRNGCQWSVLLESLALERSSYPIKLLRITAIGMDADDLRDTGRRLHDLARTLKIPFSYRTVQIKCMGELHESMFNVELGEVVAVFAYAVFHRLLYNKSLLDSVVDVIKSLKPKIVVNVEIEADDNSTSFDKRFVDVLFHCSACFDALDVIMPDRNDLLRVNFEEMYCGSQIRNVISCEGGERRIRHVKLDVWRRFFKCKGLREMSFSHQAWYQARLLLKFFPNEECYSLEANGDALITGWKTTPIFAVSLWTYV